MRDASAHVESIAAAAEVHVVLRSRARVLDQPVEQVDRRVLFFRERLTQDEPESQRPQRSDRIHEQRMRTVERVDEPAVRQRRPSPSLHRAADLERQLVAGDFPCAGLEAALTSETPQRAVGAHVVESVVVYAHVRQVRRHPLHRLSAPALEKRAIVGGVELQQRGPELKPLRPLRPAARLIFALHGEDRRASIGSPRSFDGLDLSGRQREEGRDGGQEIPRRTWCVRKNHGLDDGSLNRQYATITSPECT